MKDIQSFVEFQGLEQALNTHLSVNFYPPLPGYVKEAFIEVFKEHWEGKLDEEDLDQALSDRAYYTGGIGSCDFWQFTNSNQEEVA